MGFYGITKETIQEAKKAKEKEAQQKLAQMAEEAKTGKTINKILIEQKFGQPVYFANGVDSDLWVYDNFVIIKRNDFLPQYDLDHKVLFIPYKSIKTLQFKNFKQIKNYSQVRVPSIEFGLSVIFYEYKERIFSFSDTLEHSNASDIYFFILDKILKN